ncbi:uncharacterized protein LOC118194100 isoform X2 [Stegodyphus dumicola]|uniref:uncharacterized protein LOC118194100 isoform X2 n=1 Tax=Stegodyphus dumicola TaxID=202533 RepID=UPI0015B012D1|nr:uncharacterized protein LOC118194100 isoform X2 [Stegodyphus dumicola]
MQHSEIQRNHAKLGTVLKHIYASEVVLEHTHVLKKNLLMSFLGQFKSFCSRKSPEFCTLFQDYYLTGSYFEGLRVKEATEFDVNVVFSFPLPDSGYSVTELDVPLSYATYQLKQSYPEFPMCGKIKSFFDDDNYLIGQNVLKWFESLLDGFITYTDLELYGVLQVKTTQSGPARTLKVFWKDYVWISIDLVPVILLDTKHLHKYTACEGLNSLDSLSTCYLVPKPLKSELSCLISSDLVSRVWRIHFPETEKQFLRGKNYMKSTIQLIKALRDKENWPIPSYFIKIIGLWLIQKHPSEEQYNDDKIGSLFIEFYVF